MLGCGIQRIDEGLIRLLKGLIRPLKGFINKAFKEGPWPALKALKGPKALKEPYKAL